MSKIIDNINNFASEVDLSFEEDLTETGFVENTAINSNDINIYIKLGVNFIKGFLAFANDIFANDTQKIVTKDYEIYEYTDRETFYNLINDTFKLVYLYNIRNKFTQWYTQLVPNGTLIYGETINRSVSSIKDLQGYYPRIQYSDYGKMEGSNTFTINKTTTHMHTIVMNAKVANASELVGGFDGANFKWISKKNIADAQREGDTSIYRFKLNLTQMETTATETDLYTFDLGTNSVLNTGGEPVELDPYRFQMKGARIEDNTLNSTIFTYPITTFSSFNIHPFASERDNIKQIIISDGLTKEGFQPNTIIKANEWTIYIHLINNFVSAFIAILDNENETKLDEDFTSKEVNNIFNNFNIKIFKEWLQQFFDIIYPVNSYFLSTKSQGYPKNDDEWVLSTWENVFAKYTHSLLFFDNSLGSYGLGEFIVNVSNLPSHTHLLPSSVNFKTIKGYTKLDENKINESIEVYNAKKYTGAILVDNTAIQSYKLSVKYQTIKYTYNAWLGNNSGTEDGTKYDFTPVNLSFSMYKRVS